MYGAASEVPGGTAAVVGRRSRRRRSRLAATAVAALALTAAACGSDDAASEESQPQTTSPTVETTEPSTTAAGSTATTSPPTIPSSPAPTQPATTTAAPATSTPSADADDDGRMVVLAEEFVLADVMALGLHPFASTAAVPEIGFQGLDDYDTAGIEVLPMTTLNLEHLASMRPHTIVTLQFWVDQIGEDALRGIGDLVVIPDGLTVPERITTLGELLGRQAEAAGVVADLEAATARAAAAVPDDCRVSLAAIYPGPSPAAFVAGPWDLPTAILSTGCALDPSPADAEPDRNGRVFLSLEQLGMLDAPKLVLLQSDTVEGEQDAVDQIEANPLWSLLPAVQSGDVVVFDRLGYPGATGQIQFLGEFAALFG